MSLLIDADYTVYKCCASAEVDTDFGHDVIVVASKFSEVQRNITWEIEKITKKLTDVNDKDVILFFSDSINFRKSIDPSYKGHRNRKKPCGYRRAIEWLRTVYQVEIFPTLEADDSLGIWATREPGEHIICSPDKDMRQIPGVLYDLSDIVNVTPEEGERWHLIQTMAGDQTDGYAGVPGIGVKRADALLTKNGCTWSTVVGAFLAADLTIEDAIRNAQLAKILHNEDYDSARSSVIPWQPRSIWK